jgi:hypothetical protein
MPLVCPFATDGKETTMIDLTVNLTNGETVEIHGLSKGGVQEIVDAAKLLYRPNWSSLVIVLTRQIPKEVANG